MRLKNPYLRELTQERNKKNRVELRERPNLRNLACVITDKYIYLDSVQN